MTLKDKIEQEIEKLDEKLEPSAAWFESTKDLLRDFARAIVEATMEEMKTELTPDEFCAMDGYHECHDCECHDCGYNTRISEEQAKREEILNSIK